MIDRMINIMIMIIAVLLTNLFFVYEIGNWRYLGLIGYALIGWYWDKDKHVSKQDASSEGTA